MDEVGNGICMNAVENTTARANGVAVSGVLRSDEGLSQPGMIQPIFNVFLGLDNCLDLAWQPTLYRPIL